MATSDPTIGLLQLVALTIPAIAILKQVISQLNQRHHEYSGWNVIVTSSMGSETREFKIAQFSLISISGAGILLAINILISQTGAKKLAIVNQLAIIAIIIGLLLFSISALVINSEIKRVEGPSEG